MSQYPQGPLPPVIQTYSELPQRETAWPLVIGIILIIVACMGILMNVCGGVVNAVMPAFMGQVASQTGDDPLIKAQVEIAERFMVFHIVNSVVMLALGIILLIGGIGLVRRRRSGVTMSRVWAIARIIVAVPGAIFTYVIAKASVEIMQKAAADSGQQMPAGMNVFMDALGPVSGAINFVIWCALPVFLLIWFSRAAIKNEVARWS